MNKVYEFKWTCTLQDGLHAKEASMLLQDLQKIMGNILIVSDNGYSRVDAKSILGLLSLAIAEGAAYTVYFEGTDKQFKVLEKAFAKRGTVKSPKERL
jgi:phosphotransferase system HPr (HPr) family protein